MNRKQISILGITIVLLLLIIGVAFLSFNQINQSGAINGKVIPSKSGIVVDVIHNNKFIVETATDDNGIYNISNLPEGVYDLAFISGKNGYYFRGIQVSAGNSTIYDVNLSNFMPEFIGGEILVKFKVGLSQQQKDSVASMYDCQIMRKENRYDGTYYALNITTKDKTLFEVINQLNNDSNVEIATMSYVMRISSP